VGDLNAIDESIEDAIGAATDLEISAAKIRFRLILKKVVHY